MCYDCGDPSSLHGKVDRTEELGRGLFLIELSLKLAKDQFDWSATSPDIALLVQYGPCYPPELSEEAEWLNQQVTMLETGWRPDEVGREVYARQLANAFESILVSQAGTLEGAYTID